MTGGLFFGVLGLVFWCINLRIRVSDLERQLREVRITLDAHGIFD